MDKKQIDIREDALLSELMNEYAEDEGRRLQEQAMQLNLDAEFALPEGFEERCDAAEKKAIRRQKLRKIFRRPYADYFVLEMIMLGNLALFLFVAATVVIGRLDYRHFAIHVNIPNGVSRFLSMVVQFLLPTALCWVFAVFFRLLERKKKFWRAIIRIAAGIILVISLGNSFVQIALFEFTAPLASYTENPEHIFEYDEPVMLNLPSTNCPDLIHSIPEGAQDVEFSYHYFQIMDYEWEIHVAYTLPEDTYLEMREQLIAQYDALRDILVTEQDGTVTYDTVDYRTNLSRAGTRVSTTFDDSICRIDYTLSCFLY